MDFLGAVYGVISGNVDPNGTPVIDVKYIGLGHWFPGLYESFGGRDPEYNTLHNYGLYKNRKPHNPIQSHKFQH